MAAAVHSGFSPTFVYVFRLLYYINMFLSSTARHFSHICRCLQINLYNCTLDFAVRIMYNIVVQKNERISP